jgi:hypothetical protein
MAAAEKAERPVRTLCAVLHDIDCRISTPARIDLASHAVGLALVAGQPLRLGRPAAGRDVASALP